MCLDPCISHFGWSLRLRDYRFHLFIYLFIYFFTKIRFIETLNRKWSGIPIRHADSSERRFSLFNSRNVHLLIIADDSDVFYQHPVFTYFDKVTEIWRNGLGMDVVHDIK